MSQIKSPIEILKYLNKSNCTECGEKTCLAFAAAVSRHMKRIEGCPHLEEDILQLFDNASEKGLADSHSGPAQIDEEEHLNLLKERLKNIDLAAAAERLDAQYKDNRLTIKVLGKNFSVDSQGNFSSEIHIHSWITGPFLSYIVDGEGIEPSGQWVTLRELPGGKDWGRFFEHKCEKPMKKVADTYPDFFADMLHVFAGRQVDRHFDSDISLVLHPLPKVPILICYWKPEEGLESDMHLFFDSNAEKNLHIQYIYALVTGLLIMFEKVALRHN